VRDRAGVNAFTADLLEVGGEPATARARQLALRRFSAWLREEGESDADHLLGGTGARAGEVVALGTEDVDLSTGTATVRRGKGGRGRVVPFGPQTSRALDRYLRARRGHRLDGTPALWLGDRGKAFSYDALHKTLGERARAAGIEGFRPHRLRHTAAHRWLAAGGSEGGLMAVAGWTRPDMLLRYTRAQASARAAAEARALGLGDF
jgi:integrase/recombinase XerD